jgi:hypothetical protein
MLISEFNKRCTISLFKKNALADKIYSGIIWSVVIVPQADKAIQMINSWDNNSSLWSGEQGWRIRDRGLGKQVLKFCKRGAPTYQKSLRTYRRYFVDAAFL